MFKTLRQCISEASFNKVAIGHFNASNLETVHAIVEAAEELKVPVIVGVTEGEEAFVGTDEIVSVIKSLKQKATIPIFLNADHHYSFESVKKAIDAGFDMAIIDMVKLPLEENIAITKKCVDYAKQVNNNTGRDVLIEAELGFIGQSSKVIDTVPDEAGLMTDPNEAKYFVEKTGIDLLAPSVGNIHGIVKSGEPNLHPETVSKIREATQIPLVLHGASGNTDFDIKACIEKGVAIVHINTEIRLAYKNALELYLKEHPTEVAPYKYLLEAKNAVKEVVTNKLKVFNNIQ